MTRLNPPADFISRDWPEELKFDELTSKALLESDEVVPKEELLLRGPVPIPASADGGKTLDWSRPVESESFSPNSLYLNPIVHCG